MKSLLFPESAFFFENMDSGVSLGRNHAAERYRIQHCLIELHWSTFFVLSSDVKRGEMFKAQAQVEAKLLRRVFLHCGRLRP